MTDEERKAVMDPNHLEKLRYNVFVEAEKDRLTFGKTLRADVKIDPETLPESIVEEIEKMKKQADDMNRPSVDSIDKGADMGQLPLGDKPLKFLPADTMRTDRFYGPGAIDGESPQELGSAKMPHPSEIFVFAWDKPCG